MKKYNLWKFQNCGKAGAGVKNKISSQATDLDDLNFASILKSRCIMDVCPMCLGDVDQVLEDPGTRHRLCHVSTVFCGDVRRRRGGWSCLEPQAAELRRG